MIVADYSAGLPGARHLRAAGFGGAVRYIGFNRNPKCTNASELADFTREEIGMSLVFEQFADDWRGGWQRGYDNYQVARRHADAIGYPGHRPIYMAVDSEVIGADAHRTMQAYVTGARDAAGLNPWLVGVYGQYSVCRWLADVGNEDEAIVKWYWQCRAWSGTPIKYFDDRHLFQRVGTVTVNGIPCDINDVSQVDWGQHNEGADMNEAQNNALSELWQTVVSGEKRDARLNEDLGYVLKEVRARVDSAEANILARPVPVALTEADQDAIASKIKLGLLEDLAPLFELARRLES